MKNKKKQFDVKVVAVMFLQDLCFSVFQILLFDTKRIKQNKMLSLEECKKQPISHSCRGFYR